MNTIKFRMDLDEFTIKSIRNKNNKIDFGQKPN